MYVFCLNGTCTGLFQIFSQHNFTSVLWIRNYFLLIRTRIRILFHILYAFFSNILNINFTVKRPYFDTLFSENSVFL
jgi:hypothetical protein